jgi:hypothetical protein
MWAPCCLLMVLGFRVSLHFGCMGTASTNLFHGTGHNSRLFRFTPSLPISSRVPSPQASEIRSIRRLSPRTETSRIDLFLRSSDDFPNGMFCHGLRIIWPDRFPEIFLFVTSFKFSIYEEINCEVPSPHLLGLSDIFNFWTWVGTSCLETSLLSWETTYVCKRRISATKIWQEAFLLHTPH